MSRKILFGGHVATFYKREDWGFWIIELVQGYVFSAKILTEVCVSLNIFIWAYLLPFSVIHTTFFFQYLLHDKP